MNPTNEQELREQFVDAMWNYFGIEDKSELDHFRTIFDEVVDPLITAHTNAEIARTLDRLLHEYELDVDSKWFSSSGGMVDLASAIEAERNQLKEVK